MHEKKPEEKTKIPQIQPLALAEIRRRLELCNLTAVAIEAGVSVASVYRLAKGEGDPKASTVEAVSAVLRALGSDEARNG